MLSKILNELRKAKEPLTKTMLAQRLDIDESALDGMLMTLVHQGLLREYGQEVDLICHAAEAPCSTCSPEHCPMVKFPPIYTLT